MLKKFIPLFLILTACGSSTDSNSSCDRPKDLVLLGEKVQGDFNGDCKFESIEIKLVKESKGTPITDSDYEPNEYDLIISDQNISKKGISLGDFPKFINEGDLNCDGNDELSVVTYSWNGTLVYMSVMSFGGNSWKVLVSPQIEPGVGTDITLEELQKRVFLKEGKIHYINSDVAGIKTEKQL